jgi:ferric-dicitrate binding protein FerR (iron transport regulator)
MLRGLPASRSHRLVARGRQMPDGSWRAHITAAAALAQLQAAKRERGIPLISDEEAERRQRQADASRRRRRIWRRLIAALVAVALAVWLFLSFGPIRL